MFPDGERLLTMAEVAERLGFDETTHKHPESAAKNFCKRHGIGGCAGRYWRVPLSVFEETMRPCQVPGTSPSASPDATGPKTSEGGMSKGKSKGKDGKGQAKRFGGVAVYLSGGPAGTTRR